MLRASEVKPFAANSLEAALIDARQLVPSHEKLHENAFVGLPTEIGS
jgi:hypothetical protein